MSRSIVLAMQAEAEPERIYRAITTQEGLAAFWTPDVTASPEVGATLRLGFAEAPVDLQMAVIELEPAERVGWRSPGPWPSWTGTTVQWTLSPAPEGTTVVFRHDGWSDDVADPELGMVAMTWSAVLHALRAHVETGVVAPALA
jgi:uncharacterized protein YndB with AHSA1/START domain